MIQLPFRRSRPMHVALGGTCLFLVCAITAFFLHLSVSISDYSSEFPSLHGPQPPESDHVASDHPAEQNHATSSVASAPKATYSPARRPAIGSQTNQSQASNDHTNFDAQDYRMSFDQCGAAFGDLYTDLHRAASHRQKKGKVTPGDIDLGWRGQMGVRAMIFNSKLYILRAQFGDSGHDSTRALATLHQLDRAITASPEKLPNVEFSLSADDITDYDHAHHTLWALTRMVDDQETWLMPDFGYWSWPLELVGGYEQIRMQIEENEPQWSNKIPKLFWRGAEKQNEVRTYLKKETRGKKWADVKEVGWKNRTDVSASSAGTATSIVDHCDYQFLAHTEGKSYSGRGKYLLNCNSIVVMHKPEWLEPHHALLVPSGPQQNVVVVERDFSDLKEQMEELLQDQHKAERIADNSARTFRDRYLTPAAQACYWRELIRVWADVSFEPEAWEKVDGKKRLRGIPFETFAIQALVPVDKQCSIWQKLFG